MRRIQALGTTLLAFMASPALAAEALDGASMSVLWALPFCGILLSIALGPLLFAQWWHPHYGKAALFWGFAALIPLSLSFGWQTTAGALFHTAALEYVPFILMLFALFTAAGGLVIRGNLHGSPLFNTAFLCAGSLLASVIGTTGAAMVLIRPLIRANDNRVQNVHVFVFFIFLVANIGGSLTPLGDPPLFLGFLRGVDFFWTTKHLFSEMVFMLICLLAIFYLLDSYLYKKEGVTLDPTPDTERFSITGLANIGLISVAIAAIILSGIWRPGISVTVLGTELQLQNLMREAVMIAVGVASILITRREDREANGFEWEPLIEVAKLFAAIFTCIIPVMAMLHSGKEGAFAPIVALVSHQDGTANPAAYFWATGLLSSFLDNAPTYLVFFQMAGGDPVNLMHQQTQVLIAISIGAVFMGANTYIGNAPNFMVYSMARTAGVKMPTFFGYMLWSGVILLPLFVAVTYLFL